MVCLSSVFGPSGEPVSISFAAWLQPRGGRYHSGTRGPLGPSDSICPRESFVGRKNTKALGCFRAAEGVASLQPRQSSGGIDPSRCGRASQRMGVKKSGKCTAAFAPSRPLPHQALTASDSASLLQAARRRATARRRPLAA